MKRRGRTAFALRSSLFAAVLSATHVSAQHDHGHTMQSTSLSETAQHQLDAVRTATARYKDVEVARREGYVRFGRVEGPLMGEHWYLKDRVRESLNLNRPSTLQYAVIDGKRVLVGVAYTVYERPEEPLPEGFDGTSDLWHVHDVARIAQAVAADRPFLRWVVNRRIERGKLGAGDGRTRLVMLHAWVWSDNPDGVFALQNRALPYLRADLPVSYARDAKDDSAWGIALASADGCHDEITRTDPLARLDSVQRGSLEQACNVVVEPVRAALARRARASDLNTIAAKSYARYRLALGNTLTSEQKQRLATVIEHDPSAMGQAHQ